MGFLKRREQRPEVLDFLADTNEFAARKMRGTSGSPEQEAAAEAAEKQAARFRRRAAKARKGGAGQ